MPAQNLDKSNSEQVLKVLNMAPTLPANNSSEQLMPKTSSDEVVGSYASGPTLRDVKTREWVAISILCFVNLINYMDRFTLAGILPEVKDHFHIDNAQGGLLQTSFIASYMIFAPLFGYLGDRYSRRWIMAAGVFLWSLTTFVGSFMDNFTVFTIFRGLVGVGEASYSTIAPTIISDLFIKDVRSKMLAFFYFAIPVGSGLGYIVGSTTAAAAGHWKYALRVTPSLGLVAILLIIFLLDEPERGKSEGTGHLTAGSLKEDLRSLLTNGSFIFSTLGFTCVTFVAGALAWFGPTIIGLGITLQGNGKPDESLSFIFGAITIAAGIIGLSLGCALSQTCGRRWPRADPQICAVGLFLSAPILMGAMFVSTSNTISCYVLLFFGQVALNLNWAIVADILLYVVMPTRRATAEGVQLLVSHAIGDAISPTLIGVISESIRTNLETGGLSNKDELDFQSLQYALFTTCFVEILGGVFFLISAFFIIHDKEKVERAVKDAEPTNIIATENEHSSLMP